MKSPKGSQNTLTLVPVASACSGIRSHYGKVAVRTVEAHEVREKGGRAGHVHAPLLAGKAHCGPKPMKVAGSSAYLRQRSVDHIRRDRMPPSGGLGLPVL
jgi:hypothetical protein